MRPARRLPSNSKRLLHPAAFARGADAAPLADDLLAKLERGEASVADTLHVSAAHAEAIWDAATALLVAGEYERALAAFESLAVIAGVRADVCMARAACCEGLGRRERAKRYYQEALTLAPAGAHDDVRQIARMLNVSTTPEVAS